jgi:hypothetical protein
MSTLKDFRNKLVKPLIKEQSSIVTDPGDYNLCIKRALQTYSQVRIPTNKKRSTFARKVVEDVAVDANGQIAVSDLTGFDVGYVDLLRVETTIETTGDLSYINDGDWGLIDTPVGQVIRLSKKPTTSSTARVTHYVSHALPVDDNGDPDDDGDLTIPASDEDAVASESAANANRQLSNYYGATADSSVGADFVQFTSKRREYAALADMRHKEFTEFIEETKKRTRTRATTVRG